MDVLLKEQKTLLQEGFRAGRAVAGLRGGRAFRVRLHGVRVWSLSWDLLGPGPVLASV